MVSKILLVFDLDETLVYATDKELDTSPDFELPLYKIYKRPGLDGLMSMVFANFRVGFWSSASNNYVKNVVKNLIDSSFTPAFVWGRSRCTFELDKTKNRPRNSNYNYIKKLSKVAKLFQFPQNQILIMDDSPHKSKYNTENAVLIEEWKGNMDDRELFYLENFLQSVIGFDNIEQIQLNDWKSKIDLIK